MSQLLSTCSNDIKPYAILKGLALLLWLMTSIYNASRNDGLASITYLRDAPTPS